MFIRIVKMTFEASKVNAFLENFNKNKNQIRNFNGCRLLEIYRDKNDENVFFSYSYWESEEHLNNYRSSVFFESVWEVTKKMFSNKPEAWSVDKIDSLK